jgi:hypothetical protein
MATLNFPNAPQSGDKYTFNNRTWVYNGSVWESGVVTSQTSPGGASLATLVVEDESGAKYELDKTKNSSISSGSLSYDFNWWVRNDETTKTGLLTNKAVMELSEFFLPPQINTSIATSSYYELGGYDRLRGIGTSDEYVYIGVNVSGYDQFRILHKGNMTSTGQTLAVTGGTLVQNENFYKKSIAADDDYVYTYVNIDGYNDKIEVFNKANTAEKVTSINLTKANDLRQIAGDENSLMVLARSGYDFNLSIFNKSNNFSSSTITFDSYKPYEGLAIDDQYIYLTPGTQGNNYLGTHRYNRSTISNSASYDNIQLTLGAYDNFDNFPAAVDRDYIYINGRNNFGGGKVASYYKSNLALKNEINFDSYGGYFIKDTLRAYGNYLAGVALVGYDLIAKVYDSNLSLIASRTLPNSSGYETFLAIDDLNIFTGSFNFYTSSNINSYKWADTEEVYSTGYRMIGVSEPEPTE